jgi:hypothetical protein
MPLLDPFHPPLSETRKWEGCHSTRKGLLMPTDPRKRQKKQEQRAAKRKAKLKERTREQQTGLAERLAAAVKYPVLQCWASDDVWTQGMGWVCLSRELPGGSVAFGVFLVDRYCLGVKNAFADVAGRFAYEDRIVGKLRSGSGVRELSPAAARKLVEGSVAYAAALGLHPHADYHKAKRIFGDIDAAECKEEFEFGKDGKPCFIAGPNDTPERCRLILHTLERACGPDGFEYLIPLMDPRVLPESLRRKTARLIGEDETGAIVDQDMNFSDEQGLPGPPP